MERAKSVGELQGHRVLYQTQGSGRLQEGNVRELAGESSQFVNLGNGVWERVDRVAVVVDLGTPEVLPGRGNGTDANEEVKKLQETNTILNEQLSQARTELAALKAAQSGGAEPVVLADPNAQGPAEGV